MVLKKSIFCIDDKRKDLKRIVIKVGSAVLTHKNNIAKERMLNLVYFIAKLKKKYDVVLVTSGAVAAGYSALKLDKSKDIGKKSACCGWTANPHDKL